MIALKKTISIVTPCYNEEAGIRECYEGCKAVMERDLLELQGDIK